MTDRYRSGRRRAGVMLATVTALALVGVAGCSKAKDKTDTAAPAGSSAPSAAATTATTPDAATGGGDYVKADALAEYRTTMPTPKGAPEGGIWSEALAAEDGNELVNYLDKDSKGYVSVQLLDCRIPAVQAVKNKTTDQGEFTFCFLKPTRTVKGYPLIVPADADNYTRALVVNHVTVIAGVWVGFDEKFKGADVENFLGTLDLASLAKL